MTEKEPIYDMNKIERVAYKYLKSLGYRNIKYNKNASPDFETKDGKGWEVKPYPNYVFTDVQLRYMDYNTNIIFITKNEEILLCKFYEVCESGSHNNIYLGDILVYSPSWRPVIENGIIIITFAESLNKEEVNKDINDSKIEHYPRNCRIEEIIKESNLKKPRTAIFIGR